jgi:hypothetical protein
MGTLLGGFFPSSLGSTHSRMRACRCPRKSHVPGRKEYIFARASVATAGHERTRNHIYIICIYFVHVFPPGTLYKHSPAHTHTHTQPHTTTSMKRQPHNAPPHPHGVSHAHTHTYAPPCARVRISSQVDAVS